MGNLILAYTAKATWTNIMAGVKLADEDISDYAFSSNQTLQETLNAYQKLHPTILIIDLSDTEETAWDDTIRAVQSFRFLSEATRIILVSTKPMEPGNRLLSSLVSMSIHDVLVEEKLTVIPEKLSALIKTPATYPKAARWQRMTVDAERKESTIRKEVVKVVTKTETVIKHIGSKLVLVFNATKRAGSSFIALNLARFFSRGNLTVALVELPQDRPVLYRMAFMERKILYNYEGGETDQDIILNQFVSLPHEIEEGKEFINRNLDANRDGKLTFYVIDPKRKPLESWTAENTEALIRAAHSAVTVVDVGSGLDTAAVKPLLMMADSIICLMEPLVTEWQDSKEIPFALSLKEKGYPVLFAANKTTPKARVKEMAAHYQVDLVIIPHIAPELVQDSIHEGWYTVDKSRELAAAFQSIGKEILPNEITGKRFFK